MNTAITHGLEVFGAAPLKRIGDIKSKIKDSNRVFPLEFSGKYSEFPIIEVRIELPIYRLNNGRTRTFQREYLALHPDAPKDLFSQDQNSYAAQAAQHEILLRLVEEEELFKRFQVDRTQQTEPIICTYDGVVVNGNRRLCAWRELYYSDKDKYKYFQMIKAVILPKCDEEAIEQLETELQIQNPMRAAYHWHTIALMAKERIARGKTEAEVAKSFGQSVVDMKRYIDARDYAEQFLIQIGKPDQWSIVDKDYYAFAEMVKGRKKISSSGHKELFEAVAFAHIDEGSTGGRLYEQIPGIASNIELIAKALVPVVTTYETPAKKILDKDNGSDDIDLLAGDDNVSVEDASTIASAVRNFDNPSLIQEVVRNVIESQKQKEEEKKSKNYILNQLAKAVAIVENAVNGTSNDEANTVGIAAQLDAIEEKVGILRKWLNERDENNH